MGVTTMTGLPDISIVIPTFNRPDRLARALHGVLHAHGALVIEVIVVDDGSPDAAGVEAVVRGADPTGRTIRLVRQANRGPAAARNAGAAASTADLIVFLDDDCVVTPGCLDILLGVHRNSPPNEVLAVMGQAVWDPATRVSPLMEVAMRGAQFDYDSITDPEQVPFSRFYTACASIGRRTFDDLGGFDTTLPAFAAGEDTEFAYRLAKRGGRLVYRADAVVLHDHPLELRSFLERQRRAGRAAVEVVARHPELFEAMGLDAIADVGLREQFYVSLLRYAYVIGIEEGLGAPTRPDDLPGEDLRSVVEAWLPAWAITQASTLRSWQSRAEALGRAVADRDRRLADVVQAKDARIGALEGELARLHRFLPVRVARAIRRWGLSGG